ncbi:MAG: gliding motility lipoprotein GldH [Tannerella sp.]|jgi:gliding motility-associated lipoprotein GldH|nr:gliding motility lipoprotein GldH [Tannerella sp.]
MQSLILRHIFAAIALACCLSCSQTVFYEQYQIIEGEAWSKENEFFFTFNIDDNTAAYDIYINVRNNNNYPYTNLWLFCSEEQPVGPIVRDTIECMLSDDFGKWYGTGISIFNLKIPIRTGYHFPHKGQYTFGIRQGMRENRLRGIEEIGLTIEKAE